MKFSDEEITGYKFWFLFLTQRNKMKNLFLSLIVIIGFNQNTYAQNSLQHYIKIAEQNSPLINKSKNKNQILALDLKQINSILSKPIVNVEANVLFAPIISQDNKHDKLQLISEGANSYNGYDLSYSDGGQYQSFVSINQPLLNGSLYKLHKQKTDISTRLNDNTIELTQHELEQLVRHQYILCLKAEKQAELSNALFLGLKKQLRIMNELVENAIYKQTDLMLMQIEIRNYEIQYQQYRTEYRNSLSDLNLLCGIKDTSTVKIQDVHFELQTKADEQSPFLKKYKLDSLRIQTDQMLFNQKYRPQLNVFANAGMNAVYQPSLKRFGMAVGANLSWNIFDGNQKKIEHSKSVIKLQILDFEKQNFINRNQIYKNKFLTQIQLIENSIKITKDQLEEYQKLMKVYSFELSQAQISIMDFKNLIRDISAKKQESLLLEMQKQALISNYNYWNF